jgi:flagellar motor switch protein FliM
VASETLSQNEIDLLLGNAAPRSAPRRRTGDQEIQVYDFRRPHRVSKERLRALEALYGRMTKSLETWLMGRMRGPIGLTLQSVEQLSFGEFLLSLSSPCAAYIVDIHDSGGQQGVIAFGSELAFLIVDRLLGGSGAPTIPDRALTAIERLVVRTAAERAAIYTAESWHDQVPLALTVSGFESVPEIIQACNREDPVLVATIEVRMDDLSSLVVVALPFIVLEKFFASSGRKSVNAATGSERERVANRELTARLLRSTRVTVAARLPDVKLALRELAALRVGGILATGVATNAELNVLVGNQPRFHAAHGKVGGRLAVRILDPVAPLLPPSPTGGADAASPEQSS